MFCRLITSENRLGMNAEKTCDCVYRPSVYKSLRYRLEFCFAIDCESLFSFSYLNRYNTFILIIVNMLEMLYLKQ